MSTPRNEIERRYMILADQARHGTPRTGTIPAQSTVQQNPALHNDYVKMALMKAMAKANYQPAPYALPLDMGGGLAYDFTGQGPGSSGQLRGGQVDVNAPFVPLQHQQDDYPAMAMPFPQRRLY